MQRKGSRESTITVLIRSRRQIRTGEGGGLDMHDDDDDDDGDDDGDDGFVWWWEYWRWRDRWMDGTEILANTREKLLCMCMCVWDDQ